ncbi:hypothetical protein DIJ64_00205 [Mycobacterium leprae]|uniref:Uncharacterized protein MLCB628.06 n=1 Tax=Mycobacterium leprae TaxID=1769 RepID=O33078_MYCLR|nr:hypothetical protein DIJ64_00205 [Mycobacterium leprae]OAR20376.1 hypothetical protein A8144_11120 [Mycobacterium leprae 3125609]OAX70683.1 hypothetical protein A3216_10575 [Mycobacterium leprae 7935681]CAA75195.1 hypothetical protein [Mycobacterium leprae]
MQTYLVAGYQERQKLAQSLRNAAKAYEVDEESVSVMNNGSQGSVSDHSAGARGYGTGHGFNGATKRVVLGRMMQTSVAMVKEGWFRGEVASHGMYELLQAS